MSVHLSLAAVRFVDGLITFSCAWELTPKAITEIKLVDVLSKGYSVNDKPCPRGEVWIRGPSVTAGYYKAPELTAQAFKEGGWFATGDIGRWNQDGTLSIIDREKNLIKPPHGEYIS